MKPLYALLFIAICAIGTGARGQNLINPSSSVNCPLPTDLQPQQLYGLWRAEFAGLPQGATLLFEPHPEWADGLRGAITRGGVQALLAGDVDGGELTLEESQDGQHISATWLGTVVQTSCGQEIRGSWRSGDNLIEHAFVLRKLNL